MSEPGPIPPNYYDDIKRLRRAIHNTVIGGLIVALIYGGLIVWLVLSLPKVDTVQGTPVDVKKDDWTVAEAVCKTGYVVVGGSCAGTPDNLKHPMTAFEGESKFICNFYNGAQGAPAAGAPKRTLTATARCLKLR